MAPEKLVLSEIFPLNFPQEVLVIPETTFAGNSTFASVKEFVFTLQPFSPNETYKVYVPGPILVRFVSVVLTIPDGPNHLIFDPFII